MSLKALEEVLLAKHSLLPDSYAAGNNEGVVIDTLDYDEVLIILQAGENQTGATNDVKIQEGDESDLSDAADITGAAFTQVTTSNDNAVYVGRIKAKNFKRYLRAYAVVATDAAEMAVLFILSKATKRIPVSQDNTVAFSLNYV